MPSHGQVQSCQRHVLQLLSREGQEKKGRQMWPFRPPSLLQWRLLAMLHQVVLQRAQRLCKEAEVRPHPTRKNLKQ